MLRVVAGRVDASYTLLQVFTARLVFDASGAIRGITDERQLTNDSNVNWGPFWHPDNHHLIYATSAHAMSNFELYLIRDDGSHKTRVTFANGPDILPAFSHDGKWLHPPRLMESTSMSIR